MPQKFSTKLKSKRKLYIGSGNRDKLKELQSLLRDLKIDVRSITEFKNLPEIEENGRTFEANASKKARIYSRISKSLTIADDSGLCVRVLNNRPGIYSARFAGPGCTYEDNNRKLLRSLKDKPRSKRKAFFCSTIAIYNNGKKIKTLKGICHGNITETIQGKKGFGYDPVFIPKGCKKTFAQMSQVEKNKVSHRGKALNATKIFLKSYLKKRVF